ncbi:iron-sulfur cluster carrier protein ApbC [sulfur-oxidizing endosymbiont of Gigantopelta aegis]|uniref:iron-sulfur cluster carrier protein ApbC n=1 Tax=sulfur-oxidizing endosymbiont of Gigantopelta aegis TaxID=2794934 RepID=UPI0018DDC9C3|nr:iron-sulfur cluster carrier protein ApbC [sulfur-oxidizing endosymbiont of Gigantopelta aegis]
MATIEQVEEKLKEFIDPYMESDLVSAHCVKNTQVDGSKAIVDIELGFPHKGYEKELSEKLSTLLTELDGIDAVQINLSSRIVVHAVQKGVQPIKGVKNIVAVASGKGGVGKSTTTVNIALALAAEGATVAVLDADIYGPSMPRMLGITGKPESEDGQSLEPLVNYNIQTMSIGFLVDDDTPMIWRGPMVTQALEQLFKDTRWKDVDYLVVDLPPGTGDVQLTLAQKIPVSGAVIVTTPQDIALLDARKGLKMFQKVNVPVLGVVENMSTHICSNCGHEERIFGEGGGLRMSEEENVALLGTLPLDMSIRQLADDGKPTVVSEPDSRITELYVDIARKVGAKLALKARDYSNKFPKIVIKND